MVKALKNTREEIALQEFTRELDLFSRLNHENIVKLYGLCRDAEPHYMLLEYTDWVRKSIATFQIFPSIYWNTFERKAVKY